VNRELKFKPDFARTVDRFAAWWIGQVLDRPPVSLGIRTSRPYTGPVSTHATRRERWLDVEFSVESAIADMQRRDFVGDSLPIYNPNVGPEVTATPFGCELEFSADSSWSQPIVHEPEDWRKLLESRLDYGNVYWRTIEQMTDLAIDRSQGRFLVGMTDLHGNYDILASLRDPQALCEDLIDCPDLLRAAGRFVSRAFAEMFDRSWRAVQRSGYGSTCWMHSYHEGPSYVPSSDFWCMVSPQIGREWILPDILTEMAPLERSIFHLDGPAALRHLDLLLELPNLHALQWVYGAGNGPATRWMDVYRRILAAGKGVRIEAETQQDALTILEQLGPKGLWLLVYEPFDSIASASAYLAEIERLTRSAPRSRR
jgi:hypothetical protein